MLSTDNTVLALIDPQARLIEVMHEKESLQDSIIRLIRGMNVLKVPIVWTEQMPAKIGPTAPGIAELLAPATPMTKSSLSCCGEGGFKERLKALGRRNVVLAGMETHVCVYQTAVDLIAAGYRVEVPVDCVSSRSLQNKQIGIQRMIDTGAGISSLETVLFELLGTAEHPAFREVLKIVK